MELIKSNAIEASKIDQHKAEVEIHKLEAEASIRGAAGKAGADLYASLLQSIGAQATALIVKEET
jgi:hypothetical protein